MSKIALDFALLFKPLKLPHIFQILTNCFDR